MSLVECQRVEKDPIFRFFVKGEFQWKPFTTDFRNIDTDNSIDADLSRSKMFEQRINALRSGVFEREFTGLLGLVRFKDADFTEETYPYVSLQGADIASAIKKRSALFETDESKIEFNPLGMLEEMMTENRELYPKYIDQLRLKLNNMKKQLDDIETRFAGLSVEERLRQAQSLAASLIQSDSQLQMLVTEFMRMRRQLFYNPFLGQKDDPKTFPNILPPNNKLFDGKNTFIKFMRKQRLDLMSPAPPVDESGLVRLKMIEKGILLISFKEGDKEYFMALLPSFYALYWGSYFDEKMLGDAFKKTYMSSTRVLLRKMAKNPEKFVDSKYTQAINFLKYGAVTFSIYKKALANPAGLADDDVVRTWYDAGNFTQENTISVHERAQPLYEYTDPEVERDPLVARPPPLPPAERRFEVMGPPTKVSYLKMDPFGAGVMVDSMPFWLSAFDLDKKGKNPWMAVVIDLKNCPPLPAEIGKPKGAGELLRDNVIYRIADLIMRAFRDQCSFRLAQTFVSYKNELIERKKANKMSVYATGYEDAFPVGLSRVEYPSGPEDGAALPNPRGVVKGRVRALYFERIGIPKDNSGRLHFATDYSQIVPTLGRTEDLPESVKHSIKCVSETCRVETQNTAIGPLIPGSRPALPSQIALDCGKPGGLDFETARRLAKATGIKTDNMTMDDICLALKAELGRKLNM